VNRSSRLWIVIEIPFVRTNEHASLRRTVTYGSVLESPVTCTIGFYLVPPPQSYHLKRSGFDDEQPCTSLESNRVLYLSSSDVLHRPEVEGQERDDNDEHNDELIPDVKQDEIRNPRSYL